MKLFERDQDFSQIEDRISHCQAKLLLDQLQEFASGQILQQEIKIGLVLPSFDIFDEEALLVAGTEFSHYVAFIEDVLNVLVAADFVFRDAFKRE